MLSGVGPAEQLKAHSIPVIQDLPGVGANLKDHIAVFARFRCKQGLSLNFMKPQSIRQTFQMLSAIASYKLSGKGALTSNVSFSATIAREIFPYRTVQVVEAVAFVRSFDEQLFPASEYADGEVEDLTSGTNAPDIELLSSPFAWADHGFGTMPAGDLCSIGVALLR